MNTANRKSKLSKYAVTVTRTIEHVTIVEVEARNAEEAADVGLVAAGAVKSDDWLKGVVVHQQAKAKVLRSLMTGPKVPPSTST